MAPARAEWTTDLSAEIVSDTNVTRGQLRDDIRADGYVTGIAGLAWREPLGDDDALQARLGLRGAQYARFTRLSNAAVDAQAGYWRKLGLGMDAPWVNVAAVLSAERYRESSRDSSRIELSAETGRRFSGQLDGSAGYRFDRRYAKQDIPVVPDIPGAVFDIAGSTVFARMGYAATDKAQLDVGYAVRRGDVVATTHPNLPIFLASDAIAASHAFGPDFYDYRLRGTTQMGSGALSYALDPRASLNVGYTLGYTRAAAGLEYRNHMVNASWLYRY